jgi:hypothetical protein
MAFGDVGDIHSPLGFPWHFEDIPTDRQWLLHLAALADIEVVLGKLLDHIDQFATADEEEDADYHASKRGYVYLHDVAIPRQSYRILQLLQADMQASVELHDATLEGDGA